MGLKHFFLFFFFFFLTSITTKCKYILKHFLKSNKLWPTKECQHSFTYNMCWVKIQYLLMQGSFCKSLEGSLKMLEKSVKMWPPKKKKLWHHQDIAYVSKYYIILLIYSCFQLCQLDTWKQVVKHFIFVPALNP